MNETGVGNCTGEKPEQFDGVKQACYVNLPSTCTDLEDSVTNPGEKLSAKACRLKGVVLYTKVVKTR